MARWRVVDQVDEMPEELERFRAADWLGDAELVTDPDFDVWERHRFGPRTTDPVVRAAYERFRAARDRWEEDHPAWVRRQIAAHVQRRLERRRRMEKQWNQQERR